MDKTVKTMVVTATARPDDMLTSRGCLQSGKAVHPKINPQPPLFEAKMAPCAVELIFNEEFANNLKAALMN